MILFRDSNGTTATVALSISGTKMYCIPANHSSFHVVRETFGESLCYHASFRRCMCLFCYKKHSGRWCNVLCHSEAALVILIIFIVVASNCIRFFQLSICSYLLRGQIHPTTEKSRFRPFDHWLCYMGKQVCIQ